MTHRDRTRVAYVTQWFPPEPITVPLWIAEGLRDQGLEIEVLTGIPNYPSGRATEGYRAWRPKREHVAGFNVHRYPLYPSHDSSALGRVLNYASFSVSSTFGAQAVLRSADVSLVYMSPATAAMASLVAKILMGQPYVLYVQDLWPDTVLETGLSPSWASSSARASRCLHAAINLLYRKASAIAVISPGMKKILVQRGVSGSKVTVVPNWANEAVFFPERPSGQFRRQLGIGDGDILLCYAGNHGDAQALDLWLAGLARLKHHDRLHTVFVGEGTEKQALINQAYHLGLERVQFLPAMAPTKIRELAADSDGQIVSLAPRALFDVTIPSKVQTCLALGKPIVASVSGDAADLLKLSGAALVAEPGNCDSLVKQVEKFLELEPDERTRMGSSGRQFYLSELARGVGSYALAALLRDASLQRRAVD